MIVYLASFKTIENTWQGDTKDIFLLSSFWEHKGGSYGDYVLQERHMLDSGAFSAFKDPVKARSFDWDKYVKGYIEFINETKQKLFFELDIDIVVGLNKVEYYRKQIEDGTGLQPIPVWHPNRKAEYFNYMCENYPYVSVGTTNKSNPGFNIRANPKILQWFIGTAHQAGCKIHGLGFTGVPLMKDFKFDSVDSTSWKGHRYGVVSKFNKDFSKVTNYKRANERLIGDKAEIFSFEQWIKFQQYAINNL